MKRWEVILCITAAYFLGMLTASEFKNDTIGFISMIFVYLFLTDIMKAES
jgi:hypothetical protein